MSPHSERRQDETHAQHERRKAKEENDRQQIVTALNTIAEKTGRPDNETRTQKTLTAIREWGTFLGIWFAAFVAIWAISRGSEDSKEQRNVMQGQLSQMQIDSDVTRAQLAAVLILKWETEKVTKNGQHYYSIVPDVINKSDTKAVDLRGWTKAGYVANPPGPLGAIIPLFTAKDRITIGPFIVGPHDNRYLQPPATVTDDQLRDVAAGKGIYLLIDYLEYRDVFGGPHHIRACAVVDRNDQGEFIFTEKIGCNSTSD